MFTSKSSMNGLNLTNDYFILGLNKQNFKRFADLSFYKNVIF